MAGQNDGEYHQGLLEHNLIDWTSDLPSSHARDILCSGFPVNPQLQSPLWSRLPGEIREMIFSFVITEIPDPSRTYSRHTPYSRPDFLAPHRIDIALLLTCRLAYQETWFLPWRNAEHTMFFTAQPRKPEHSTIIADLLRWNEARLPNSEQAEELMSTSGHDSQAIKGDWRTKCDVEVRHIRIFAQLYKLPAGWRLLFDGHPISYPARYIRPQHITITLRHTDWWYWEEDNRLWLDEFTRGREIPDCVQTLQMELESLERKKDQVDKMAQLMIDNWNFKVEGGKCFSAKGQPLSVIRWRGSSIINKEKWVRDESEDGMLDFYVLTVTWKQVSDIPEEDRKLTTKLDVGQQFDSVLSRNQPSRIRVKEEPEGSGNWQQDLDPHVARPRFRHVGGALRRGPRTRNAPP